MPLGRERRTSMRRAGAAFLASFASPISELTTGRRVLPPDQTRVCRQLRGRPFELTDRFILP